MPKESLLSKTELEQRLARKNAVLAGSRPLEHLDAAAMKHEQAGRVVDPAQRCALELDAVYHMLRCLQAENLDRRLERLKTAPEKGL